MLHICFTVQHTMLQNTAPRTMETHQKNAFNENAVKMNKSPLWNLKFFFFLLSTDQKYISVQDRLSGLFFCVLTYSKINAINERVKPITPCIISVILVRSKKKQFFFFRHANVIWITQEGVFFTYALHPIMHSNVIIIIGISKPIIQ